MRSESNKIPDDENNIPQYILENIENEKKIGMMISEFKNDLQSNPAYRDFFEKFDPMSVETFIESYASKKANYIVFGEMHRANEEKKVLRYQIEAQERLWEIQRKKLFNIQCRWRAGLIDIKEVEISHDFEYWESNIGNVPFLTPITEDEFELYYDYVMSENFNDFDLNYIWMGFQDIKETYKKEGTVPPWFEYYDLRMGSGSLMELPDVKGDKEKFYLNTWRKSKLTKHKVFQKKNLQFVKTDTRPILPIYDLNVLENFIKNYESSRILDYFNLYEREMKKSNDDLEQAIKILREADEQVPVDSNEDWRDAIISAARKYEQQKIADALQKVYRQYVTRMNFGIAQENHNSEENLQRIKEWINQIKLEIIQAREMLGEPADLNFS